MKYLLTGVTGELGNYVFEYLKEQVALEDIAVLVRSEEKAAPFKKEGVEVHIADFGDYDRLLQAFKGVDRMLFVSSQPGAPVSRGEQHKNVVAAAKETGISFIAYTSFPKGADSNSFLAQDHILTENLLTESGIAHTFLRNNWYLENEAAIIQAAVSGHPFTYSAGEGKVGWALKREYAEAAVNVLTNKIPTPEVLELSGPLTTYAELAEALKVASVKEFDVISMSDADYKEVLVNSGVPESGINFVLPLQKDIREHQLEVDSSDFVKTLGKPLTPLVDALKEFLGE